MFWNRIEFLDVFKTQGKPLYFACFSCARRSVRVMQPRIPKPTSGHLDRSFFFGVQRSDYDFIFEVSRGPFSISILRCPEVRLGFQLWCVRRSDWFWFVRTSDYRFNLRCPEVGLELCVHPDPRSFGLFRAFRTTTHASGVIGLRRERSWLLGPSFGEGKKKLFGCPCLVGGLTRGEGEIC